MRRVSDVPVDPRVVPVAEGYRIEVFADTDDVTADDVLALWASEAVLSSGEAARRVHETHLVATDESTGRLAAVTTTYLQRNPQLAMDLWYYRAYTSVEHRMTNVAVQITDAGRRHLEQRFVSGVDTRGAGVVFEVENESLRRHFNQALWLPLEFTFIGENAHGDHVRVRYFPGATVPTAPPAVRAR